jgi:hypothetical protein
VTGWPDKRRIAAATTVEDRKLGIPTNWRHWKERLVGPGRAIALKELSNDLRVGQTKIEEVGQHNLWIAGFGAEVRREGGQAVIGNVKPAPSPSS